MTTVANVNTTLGRKKDAAMDKVEEAMNSTTLTAGQKATKLMQAQEQNSMVDSAINFSKAVYQFNGRLGS